MLKSSLDPERLDGLADTLASQGRIVIPQIFQPDVAGRLFDELRERLPWRLAFRDTRVTGEHQQQLMTQEEFAALGPGKAQALRAQVIRQARDHFQYLYHHFDLAGGRRNDEPPGLFLYKLLDYLESPAFMEVIRTLTGTPELNDTYAHATLYSPGNFLKIHEDVTDGDDRRYAFVFGFTRDWVPDMGGLLHFLDDAGQVTETVVPGFNSLTVFAVPTSHLVSAVAPWADQPRLAVTGWFKAKNDDGLNSRPSLSL